MLQVAYSKPIVKIEQWGKRQTSDYPCLELRLAIRGQPQRCLYSTPQRRLQGPSGRGFPFAFLVRHGRGFFARGARGRVGNFETVEKKKGMLLGVGQGEGVLGHGISPLRGRGLTLDG